MSKCAAKVIEAARREGRRALLLHEAYELLSCYGVRVPRYCLAHTPEEAAECADKLGYPVVLKIVSPDILHKSDVGGVRLGIASGSEAARAFREIVESVSARAPSARIVGVLVQEMVPSGLEVIIGGLRDQIFGPMVAFGLGGVYTEVYEDVAFRVAPLARIDAESMLEEVKASRLLHGYRGLKPRDRGALIDMLMRVSRLIVELPVAELDLNPVMSYEEGRGAIVADARMLLA